MRKKRTLLLLLPALLPLLGLPGASAPALLAQDAGRLEFESYRLDNDLHVILAPDPQSTAVAVNLWYDVGSRNERAGRSGFAHLFEHLMFQGSENVSRGDHFQYVERAGGQLNATTSEDRTNYFETMPPERMNMALWLESDRMRSLRITDENMQREVEVVKEERRQGIDNAPYGTSQLQASYNAVYDSASCFPYAHSVIGSMEDLDAAELSDVQEFFDLYYAPNNATLTVVGAFEPEEAKRLIEEYFADIPAAATPPATSCESPFDHLPVEREVHDANAQLPAVWVSYGIVEKAHEDAAALGVLGQILGSGQSSRLHQRLVRAEQAAVQTAARANTRLGDGILQLIGIANQGVQAERLLELFDEEVAKLKSEGVTEAEVDRAKSQVRASTIMGRQTVMGRAEALQAANHYHGTPEAIHTVVERIEAVTAQDVQRVAEAYLRPDNRAVVFTRPGTGEGDR